MSTAPRAARPASLEGFSPEAQAAIQSQSITGSWELRKLQKLMGELSHFDEVNEAAIAKAKKWMIVGIVAAFLGIFAGGMIMAFTDTGWGFLVTPAAAIMAVISGLKWSRLKKADLINDFRLCLRPGLRDIANDLDPDKKIRVRMDLAGPAERKKTSQQQLPPGRYRKLKETVYQDPWCEMKLPLLDGSTAVVEFEVCWRKLEREYRTSRGKIKSKTKWRKECTAAATLIPASPARWDMPALNARVDPAAEKAKLVEKDGVWSARMERYWTFKGLSDPPTDAPPAREVVGMLLRLYSAKSAAPGVAQ